MGGGLIQLISQGGQSVDMLIGNPQISYFKTVYHKHTNFSIEYTKQNDFDKNMNFFGKSKLITINRIGDLLREIWLEITLPSLPDGYGWVDNIGHALINNASLSIGGIVVSEINGSWMNILNDLSLPVGKQKGMDRMIGNVDLPEKLRIPLSFLFFKNNICVPLISLGFSEVKVKLDFNSLENLLLPHIGKPIPNMLLTDVSMWSEYIYLDTEERRNLAVNQEVNDNLIEQLQYQNVVIDVPVESISINLDFDHPVKELIWVVLRDDSKKHNQWCNWTDNQTVRAEDVITRNGYVSNKNPVSYARLTIGNHERFEKCDGNYFNTIQPYKYHTNVPSSRGINVYSFALKPEEHQPSGTLDFSGLDEQKTSVKLNLSFGVPTCGIVKIFAINYNYIEYKDGMCKLKYPTRMKNE
jgi:hypothetical protein